MGGFATEAERPGFLRHLSLFARRHKVACGAVAAVALAVAAGASVSTWQAIRATRSAEESKAVLKFFEKNVLAAGRPEDLGGGLGIDVTILNAVNAAEPQIGDAFADRPRVEASIRSTLGNTYWFLGEAESAIRQHERALELKVAELGSEHPDTLMCMADLANAYLENASYEKAVKLGEETLELRKEILGVENPTP